MSGCNQNSRPKASGVRLPDFPEGFRQLKLEDEISKLELELIAIAARLEEHGLEPGRMAELQAAYTDITIALEALIKEWQGD